MKTRYLLMAAVTFSLASCAPSATMDPYDNGKFVLLNADNTIDIDNQVSIDDLEYRFTVYKTGIEFYIKNSGQEAATIIWDRSTIVKENGTVSRVFHVGTKYIDRNNSQPPSVIPPSSVLSDGAWPTDLVYFDNGYYTSGWKSLPLFSLAGNKPVTLNLAYELNGKQANHAFKFMFIPNP